ncbi:hypothetical protein [Anaerovibrio slackiae]|uniref:hypothetical protein n=1 Tax=Anaerovibrio slackiae TaxID=2652309 RepID=UPI003F13AF0A
MSVNDVKRQLLLEGITLPSKARVLISWQDDRLAAMLREFLPTVQVDYLMNMDFAAFLQESDLDKLTAYDCIIDNGLLEQAQLSGPLLQAMGLHLQPGGFVRAVFSASMDKEVVGKVAYVNNYDEACLCFEGEYGEHSFYIAKLGLFQQSPAWLQCFWTPEVRRRLSYLLQRIDFDVRQAESVAAVKQLCREYHIDRRYLTVFVDVAVIHKSMVKKLLQLQ